MPIAHCNKQSIYYEIHGQGEPLLLITGLGANSAWWSLQVPYFSRHFQVIVMDNRDVGQSSLCPEHYNTTDMAADAAALLDFLKIKQAHVLGQSMGGAIAQELAIHHPEKVKKLILFATFSHVTPWFNYWLEHRMDLAKSNTDLTLLAKYILVWSYTDKFLSDEIIINQLVKMRLEAPHQQTVEAYLRQATACMQHNSKDQLDLILHPTLVCVGKEDIVAHPTMSEEIAKKIPSCELLIFPHGGHALNIEYADEFNQAIADWLMN